MILDLIYGYSKPLEKASYYSKSKGRKEESIRRVFKKLILVKSSYTRNNYFQITFMFSAQSLLVGNGTSVTCLRKSREPITALNVATYVTPLMVRNFWLCKASKPFKGSDALQASKARKARRNSKTNQARD